MIGDGERGELSRTESAAFARWFEQYRDRLVAQCLRILRDRAAAEDIAQETLLRAWLGRERMREDDVGVWLSVVARNLCISYMRRQRKQVPTEFLPDTPDPDADPARHVERNESRRAVRAALRTVGKRHREILARHWIEGVEYEDIAGELGLSPSGTRAVLFRARRAMRERLAAVGEGMAAFVAGIRVRARLYAEQVSQPISAVGAPLLQAGLSLAVTGALTLGGPASVFAAIHESPVRANTSFVSAPARAGEQVAGASSRGGAAASSPAAGGTGHGWNAGTGLRPDGDIQPSAPGPHHQRIWLPGIYWQDDPNPTPYPWQGSKVQQSESFMTTKICDGAPALCR